MCQTHTSNPESDVAPIRLVNASGPIGNKERLPTSKSTTRYRGAKMGGTETLRGLFIKARQKGEEKRGKKQFNPV